jgi:hypothetical protein
MGFGMLTLRSKLMRAYLPVPHSWYMTLLGVNFAAASELLRIVWQHPQSISDHLDFSYNGEDVTAANAYLGLGVICGDRRGETHSGPLPDSS